MLVDESVVAEIALGVLFFIYNFSMLYLTDSILEKSSVSKYFRLITAISNTILFVSMVSDGVTVIMEYLVMSLIFLVEFFILYKSKAIQKVFMVSIFTLHIMSVRGIIVALFSILHNMPLHKVVENKYLFTIVVCVTTAILIGATLLVKKTIPAKSLRIITQKNELFVFIIAWSFICNIYLYCNAWVFTNNESYSFLNSIVMTSSILILVTLYVIVLLALKSSYLLGYKDKNIQLEHKISMEQQYRDSIVNDAIAYYEFNLTKNFIALNFGGYSHLISREISNNYRAVTNILSSCSVYKDDLHAVHQYTSEKNLMKQIANGISETSIEHRRLSENGNYIWVKSTTNLVIDQSNGDVKGFTYIKDVDHKKRKHIELKEKAERDVLTGLYNKSMTGILIDKFLDENSLDNEKSAVLIIDVDNFKTVNDSLGHTFGDAVLCELAEKLKRVFRDNDIIGRIGGDEFMAFMTNIKEYKILNEKAKVICDNFSNSYEGNAGELFSISSSIGIAIAPQHGSTFEELYKHADIALYNSKNSGKDTFTVYNGEAFVGYQSNRTEIDSIIAASQKGFKDNRIENIFKILYGSDTSTFAICSVLKLLVKHFLFSRGYVFELDKDNSEIISNTFEWCSSKVESQKNMSQHLPIEMFKRVIDVVKCDGVCIINSPNVLDNGERAWLEQIDLKFSIQFGIFEDNKLIGIIGFDDYIKERESTDTTISEIATICNVFALFIIKQRAMNEANNNFAVLSGIMDRLDTCSYVVSKDTKSLLFVNKRTKDLVGDINIGGYCYSSFRGEKDACSDCPIKGLTESFDSKCVLEIYNKKVGIFTEATATYVKWINGETACLVNCVDITKYKKAPMP